MIHGACLDPRTFDDFLMPSFAQAGYDTYALSLRYHETWRGYMLFHGSRIRDYVADVAAAVATFPEAPILLGHSMGGYIIMKYLEQYDHIPAAILLSSIPVHGFWRGFFRTIRMFFWEHAFSTLTLRRNLFQVSAAQFEQYCFVHPIPPERLQIYHSRLHLESFPAIWDMVIGDLPHPERAHTPPMLVMGGAHDVIFRVAEIEATAKAYHADCFIYPHYAHDFIREEGHSETSQFLLKWLEKQGL